MTCSAREPSSQFDLLAVICEWNWAQRTRTFSMSIRLCTVEAQTAFSTTSNFANSIERVLYPWVGSTSAFSHLAKDPSPLHATRAFAGAYMLSREVTHRLVGLSDHNSGSVNSSAELRDETSPRTLCRWAPTSLRLTLCKAFVHRTKRFTTTIVRANLSRCDFNCLRVRSTFGSAVL